MSLTVDAIFDRMNGLFLADRAAGVKASVAYKVTGPGGGDFTCIVAGGAFTLVKGEAKADAQATVTISAEDWIALNEGRLDPMAAYMSGKLKAAGDQNLLMKFPKLFKRPANTAGSGIPLAELVPSQLAKLAQAFKVVVGDQSWGAGPELKGDEAAVRGLVEGRVEPGPALLGGQLAFAGDMALLRGAWSTWSADPVKPRRPKRPGMLQLVGMWIKGKLGLG
ncbi:MAG TPA: SCP2 sterol-binding domain-containing protein [Holophagaceae bacterium]|nr:SCP2 sterol-binding domain-containing protein [Holophagaceae bacterium]